MPTPASPVGQDEQRSNATALLMALPAAVAHLTGPDHRFAFVNDAARDLVGGRELLGMPVRDALPEVVGQGYVDLLDAVLASGRTVRRDEAEVWFRRPDGSRERHYLDLTFRPVRAGDAVTGVLVQADDVTEHVADKQGLRRRTRRLVDVEERYRTLFDTMLHGVVYQDADGAIIAVNPAAAEILGADADDLVGLRSTDPAWQAVHEDGSPFPGEEHPAMVALRSGEVVPEVVMGVTHGRTGARHWILVTAVPDAFDESGRPQRVYTMFTDVTEQRRTAAELRDRDRFVGRLRDANVLGVLVADEEHVVDANEAFLSMLGRDRTDVEEGRLDWRALTPPEWAPRDDAALGELRRTGACRSFEKEYLHADGRRVPVLVGAAVTTPEPLEWVTFVVDLSDRQRAEEERARLMAGEEAARAEAQVAEERLGFLLRAGALVTAGRDRGYLLQHAARLMVPDLADVCTVFVPDEEGVLRLAAGAARDQDRTAFLESVARRGLPHDGGSLLERTFRTGHGFVVPDVAAALEARQAGPAYAGLAERTGARSAIVVPLRLGGDSLGVLGLSRAAGRPAFEDADLAVVEEVARRLAVGLANADVSAREHGVAETLQRSVLPDLLPAVPGLDLAVRYLPATEGVGVGGDWYDVFAIDEDRTVLVLGDVVGHDLASASAMNQVRTTLRAYGVEQPDPATVLRRANAALARLLPDALATVFCAVLDRRADELTYANAGHPPALLIAGPDQPAGYLSESAGLMLGVADDAAFSSHVARFAPGSALLLYSDGLVEDRRRSIDEGLSALAAAVRDRRAGTAEELCVLTESALLGAPSRIDDVCLLAVVREA